jgi:hypothetical protein
VSRNGGETRPADRRNLCKQRTNRAEDSICGLLGPNVVWQIVFYALANRHVGAAGAQNGRLIGIRTVTE